VAAGLAERQEALRIPAQRGWRSSSSLVQAPGERLRPP